MVSVEVRGIISTKENPEILWANKLEIVEIISYFYSRRNREYIKTRNRITMLKITDLHANIDGKSILKGINLEIKPGEVHAIMGPNGSGKSTLASVIAGKEEYEVEKGEITFEGQDIDELSVEERAHKGVFLSFQYPVEIPGVTVTNFMKTSLKRNA